MVQNWEYKTLKRLNVMKSKKWLNKTDKPAQTMPIGWYFGRTTIIERDNKTGRYLKGNNNAI
jgi:hypothetical protein